MTEPLGTVSIEKAVRDALTTQINVLKEHIIKEAVANFETRLRERIGNTAIAVSDFYSVETRGQELIIHVKIDAPKGGA